MEGSAQTSSVICPPEAESHTHKPTTPLLQRSGAAALCGALSTEQGTFLPSHGAQGLTTEPWNQSSVLKGNKNFPTFIARAIKAPSVGCPITAFFLMMALLATQPA